MKNTTLIFGAVVIGIIGTLFGGFALSVLWGWFVVPVFDTPPLGIAQAIGLAMIVSFLTGKYKLHAGNDTAEKIADLFSEAFFMPTYALVIGWIIYQFV